MKGVVFDIQHFSVHDGPGIRTTVFLKGCQIRCRWCHNPEGLSLRPHELSFAAHKCIGCGGCVSKCPNGAHQLKDGVHQIDRELCRHCGRCTVICPTGALSLAGKEWEASEVINVVLKDRAYFGETGGMTVSGGEPMMQPDFVLELMQRAKAEGLNTALETNLCYDTERLRKVIPYVDLFLTDWKETDSAKHRAFTGMGNELVLKNIRELNASNAQVLIRCPIIPGFNDTDEHFQGIAAITTEMPGLIGAEVLPYHNLGVSKVHRFGLEKEFDAVELSAPSQETVQDWISRIRSFGGRLINE